jgi:chemotaxis protein methyltransferase CheR
MFSISIPEARKLIGWIHESFGMDLRGVSMASFRWQVSQILETLQDGTVRTLMQRIRKDPVFFDQFIRDISVGSPDMFRDPDLWIHLRDHLLPILFSSWRYPEILIPDCVTGGELYTLLVFLHDTGIDYRVDLAATCKNNLIRQQILAGELDNSRYKNSRDNFDVFHPGSSFDRYLQTIQGKKFLKPDLLKGLDLRVQDEKQPLCSDRTSLILYRNRMLRQNRQWQSGMLSRLFSEMKEGTLLVTGIGESIDGFGFEHSYRVISPDLKIYIKKNGL